VSLDQTPGAEDDRPVRRVANVRDFESFCKEVRRRPRLALDTEFIAEDSYQPNLCLIQLAFDDELVVIHRGAKPHRRYELLDAISLLSPAYLLSIERWPFHSGPPDH